MLWASVRAVRAVKAFGGGRFYWLDVKAACIATGEATWGQPNSLAHNGVDRNTRPYAVISDQLSAAMQIGDS